MMLSKLYDPFFDSFTTNPNVNSLTELDTALRTQQSRQQFCRERASTTTTSQLSTDATTNTLLTQLLNQHPNPQIAALQQRLEEEDQAFAAAT
jgi:hypothetical protein